MWLFILPLVLSIIFAVLTIVFLLISFFKERENGRFSIIASTLSAFLTLLSLFNITVPPPTIYPLDNEIKEYSEKAEVSIVSYPIFKTYYSLDGSDPEFGEIYKDVFTITNSTTVSAKNKFLLWWSDIAKNTFIFKDGYGKELNRKNTIRSDLFENQLLSYFSNYLNDVSQTIYPFPFRVEYNVIYPETKVIKVPTPEESGTYSIEFPLDLRAEEYQSDKVPANTDIHGFVVNNLYYCSDDNSVTDISGYNYYIFADYWLYLHTIDISFMDFDGFDLMFNGATIVLREKETQKRIVLQDDYLDGQFVQFKCSTGQYIIEVQKGGISYTQNLNINKSEKLFLAFSADEYYYLSPSDKDSYITPEDNDIESSINKKVNSQSESNIIPEAVLSAVYEDDVQLLIDGGKYIEAANLYKSKISVPTSQDWCNVGNILNYYIGDYDQAIIYYMVCLQCDPTYEQAEEGLKYAYEHGGSIEKFE